MRVGLEVALAQGVPMVDRMGDLEVAVVAPGQDREQPEERGVQPPDREDGAMKQLVPHAGPAQEGPGHEVGDQKQQGGDGLAPGEE